jgi:phosphatidate cytidylyltransferase
MKTRILSGLIMLPLLVILILGGYVLYAGCFVIGVMAVYEFFKGFRAMDIHPCFPIACAAAIGLYMIGIFDYMLLDQGMEMGPVLYMLWFFAVVLASLLYLFKINDRKLEDAMATITGVFYIVFFSYHIALISQWGIMSILVWLVVITAFGTDIMAYFSGYAFGKHKLCPNISPKKTIEGSVGGTLGSIILCGVFGYFFVPDMLVHCLIVGLLGGVISQFGDLTASVFKRKMGIKDYGNLIPGHGGILDRFDSVLFTGPLVYYYFTLLFPFN